MLSTQRERLQRFLARVRQAAQPLRPYLHICHLHRPVDLLLLLLPALWTLSLASAPYHYPEVVALLLALLLGRSAAWVYNDLHDATMLPLAPESFTGHGLVSRRHAWRLFAGLLATSALLLLTLGPVALLWSLPALALLLGYPYIKRRTLLTQPYLALCIAWVVVMAHLVSPGINSKALWLLFTATLLWATANTLLYSLPRRDYEEQAGIGSLLYLFGENTRKIILALHTFTVLALWFAGRQATLGYSFGLGLLAALALASYQQWLLVRHPGSGATRAYRNNMLFGLVVLLGLILERL